VTWDDDVVTIEMTRDGAGAGWATGWPDAITVHHHVSTTSALDRKYVWETQETDDAGSGSGADCPDVATDCAGMPDTVSRQFAVDFGALGDGVMPAPTGPCSRDFTAATALLVVGVYKVDPTGWDFSSPITLANDGSLGYCDWPATVTVTPA
jgi:hypothetical protein